MKGSAQIEEMQVISWHGQLPPLDLFVKGAETGDWLAALDDFRNWLISAGVTDF